MLDEKRMETWHRPPLLDDHQLVLDEKRMETVMFAMWAYRFRTNMCSMKRGWKLSSSSCSCVLEFLVLDEKRMETLHHSTYQHPTVSVLDEKRMETLNQLKSLKPFFHISAR